MERDVVFCVAPNVRRTEFQYALRSLNFLPHGRVFVVGPANVEWVRNVTFVPMRQRDKWTDLTRMWDLIPTLPLTAEFVYTEDDYFITAPVEDIPNYHCGPLVKKVDPNKKYAKRIPPGWQSSLYATYHLLKENGVQDPLSFDVHIPMVVEKNRIPHAWDPGNLPLRYRDLVGNTATREPVKVPRDAKCHTIPIVDKIRETGLGFLSSSDQTFVKSGAEAWLKELFPEPCRYEKEHYMDFEPASPYDEPAVSPRAEEMAKRKARIVERRIPRNDPPRVKLDTGEWVDEADLDLSEEE